MIHIGLAEQNRRIAEVLKEKIELSPDFKVDLILTRGAEFFDINADNQWDLVILDGGLLCPPKGHVIKEYSQRLLELVADLPLVLASSFVDVDQQISAFSIGARGVLSKSDQPEKIHQALFQSIEGAMKLSAEMRRSLVLKFESQKAQNNFSKVDLELTSLISEGKSLEFMSVRLHQPKKEVAKRIQELIKNVFSEE